MNPRRMNLKPQLRLRRRSSSSGSVTSRADEASYSIHVRNTNANNTSSPTIVPDSADHLADRLAAEAAEEERSDFLATLPPSLLAEAEYDDDSDGQNVVAPFVQEEIVLGPRLGSGEFSHVYEVSSFQLLPDMQEDDDEEEEGKTVQELNKRLHMKHVEKYRQTNMSRYALKHLKECYLERNGLDDYVQAAVDLALEAEFLASLSHPNIIKLRGITYSGASGFANGPCGYFLIIDRLQETLAQRIKRWRDSAKGGSLMSAGPSAGRNGKRMPRALGSSLRKFSMSLVSKTASGAGEQGVEVADERAGRSLDETMDERLGIALQISAALKYLHSHSIIFRDLKPANIGFDVRGDVKIFDFGLARVVPEGGDDYSDLYEMSGAGSPRYMPPEGLAGEAYNLKADVYTFAIVLWEMLSCELPYSFVKSREQLHEFVVLGRGRPEIDPSWPLDVRGMLESSFHPDMNKRPKMKLWYNIIRGELASLRGGCMDGLNDTHLNRRRTIASMQDIMMGLDKESFYKAIRKSAVRKSTEW